MAVDLGILTFAFSLGVATFFSPCAVALVPAYVGYFTGTGQPGSRKPTGRFHAALDGARFGAAAAGGVLGLFALGGLLIYVLRTQLGWIDSGDLLSTFTGAGTAVGIGMIVLGGLMLASRSPSVSLPVRAPQSRTPVSMVAFGIVFAIASMGCTLPLFFGVLGAALSQDAIGSLVTLLAFGAGIAGLLLAVSIATAVAEDEVRRHLRRVMPYVKPASAILLIAAGLYVVNFYLEIVPV